MMEKQLGSKKITLSAGLVGLKRHPVNTVRDDLNIKSPLKFGIFPKIGGEGFGIIKKAEINMASKPDDRVSLRYRSPEIHTSHTCRG